MSIYDQRDKPAYSFQDVSLEYAKNPHIIKWWTAEHDNLIKQEIDQWAWSWGWNIAFLIEKITPRETLDAWRDTDPLCKQYAWYNILMYFALSRARQLGLTKKIRKPKWKQCPLCNQKFIESSLPVPLVERLGADQLDFCAPCLRDSLLWEGDQNKNEKEILEYLNNLAEVLGKVPGQGYGGGIEDLLGYDYEQRLAIIRVLKTKPTVKRVKDEFGSWLNALIQAGVLEDGTRPTARGTQTIALDGDVCLSLGEKTIDDYLFQHGIPHEKEPYYPDKSHRADFLVGETFVEYFGLAGDPEYDKKTKMKKKICKDHGILLISIYPADLVSPKKLENKLSPLMQKPE